MSIARFHLGANHVLEGVFSLNPNGIPQQSQVARHELLWVRGEKNNPNGFATSGQAETPLGFLPV
jgi:hypothetical protein